MGKICKFRKKRFALLLGALSLPRDGRKISPVVPILFLPVSRRDCVWCSLKGFSL